MALSEFSLIEQYFAKLTVSRDDVVVGIGDDCAVLACPPDKNIAVSIDTLVEGVHFFADVDPISLGYKSLAVGLSDLAAMGAKPVWFTLALTLPEVNEDWLESFARGLAELALQHQIQLVGGDTTRGPLTISIQVHGLVDKTHVLRRDTAQVGDLIYVTGTLGDAGAALQTRLQNWQQDVLDERDWQYLQQRLERPTPRIDISPKLLGIAHAAIDISDGLLADLGHILDKSHKGAIVQLDRLPLSPALTKLDSSTAHQLALSSGDDYELCFTVPRTLAGQLDASCDNITCIGEITDEPGLKLIGKDLQEIALENLRTGYDHFSA
ncbi:thiamine-phosphate kinase [Methylophaga sp. OBS4]|uniref:thiamine-phosphate kinase n=1 Tax=Methylophaga sp. OBS4 TaxID=2991935 RepID=UPI002254F3FC|nr:thiamine-phosphate kinase [Methylophaga sp. OBS4]MCX4187244.1 thiamine-phosphate kinase [Methylophaga sp. OBS4]